MERIPLFAFFLTLAACGGPDNTNPDDNVVDESDGQVDESTGSTGTFNAQVASERTYAEILEDGTVRTWSEPTEDVSVTITEGDGTTYTVETVFNGEIGEGATAQVDHYEDGLHFVSNVTTVSTETKLKDCNAISGDFICTYVGYDTEYPVSFAMTSCKTSNGLGENIVMNGYHFVSEDYEGYSDDGNLYLVDVNDRSVRKNCVRR